MKKPSHRVFDYTPRFYKPEEDEHERRKRKLGFNHQRKIARRKQKNPFIWIIFIIFVIFIYLKLKGFY